MTTAETIKDLINRKDALHRYLNIDTLVSQIAEEELKTAEEISDRLGRVLSGLRKSLIDKLSNQNKFNPGA